MLKKVSMAQIFYFLRIYLMRATTGNKSIAVIAKKESIFI